MPRFKIHYLDWVWYTQVVEADSFEGVEDGEWTELEPPVEVERDPFYSINEIEELDRDDEEV